MDTDARRFLRKDSLGFGQRGPFRQPGLQLAAAVATHSGQLSSLTRQMDKVRSAALATSKAQDLFSVLGAMSVKKLSDPVDQAKDAQDRNSAFLMASKQRKSRLNLTEQIFQQKIQHKSTADKIVIKDLHDTVTAVAFGNTTNRFAVATTTGMLDIYDSRTAFKVHSATSRLRLGVVSAMRFLQTETGDKRVDSNELLLVSSFSGKLRCFALAPAAAGAVTAALMNSSAVKASRSGQSAVVAGLKGQLDMIELESFHWGGNEIKAMDCSAWRKDSASAMVVVAGSAADVCVCELSCYAEADTGEVVVRIEERFRLKQTLPSLAVCIDVAGEIVAFGGEGKMIQVWHVGFATRRTTDGDCLAELLLQCKSAIHSICLSPDGSTLAVGTSTHVEVYELLHTELYLQLQSMREQTIERIIKRFDSHDSQKTLLGGVAPAAALRRVVKRSITRERRNSTSRDRVLPSGGVPGEQPTQEELYQLTEQELAQLAAATKIQAARRGCVVRRTLAAQFGGAPEPSPASAAAPSKLPPLKGRHGGMREPPLSSPSIAARHSAHSKIVAIEGWSHQERHAAQIIQAHQRGQNQRRSLAATKRQGSRGFGDESAMGLRGTQRRSAKAWRDPLYKMRPLIYLKEPKVPPR